VGIGGKEFEGNGVSIEKEATLLFGVLYEGIRNCCRGIVCRE
jgi:hypothetical protein